MMDVQSALEAAIRRAEERGRRHYPELKSVSLSPDVAIALYRVALSTDALLDEIERLVATGELSGEICWRAQRTDVSLEALGDVMRGEK